MERRRIFSGAPRESIVGDARAARVGDQLAVAGTTALGPGDRLVGHGELFRDIRPAATLVEVSRLIDPEMQMEIEADAVIGAS